jgi:hypothetical protein
VASNQTQDGIATSADAHLTSHIGTSLTSSSEPKLTKRFLQSYGTLGMRTTKLWQPFDKDLLGTGALLTEETTYLHEKADWTPNRGKITQGPRVATLDARRCGSTGRAESRWRYRTQSQSNFFSDFYSLHFDIGQVWKNDHRMMVVLEKDGEQIKCLTLYYTTLLISKVA